MHVVILRRDAAKIADVSAAVDAGIAVKHFAPRAGARQSDAVSVRALRVSDS